MFTSDFLASIIIFFTVLNLGMFALHQSVTSQTRFNQQTRMVQQAYQTAGLLIRTPGYPADWNSTNVQVVGLADPNHVIQPAKLLRLKRLDFATFRSQTRLAGSNFFLTVTVNGSLVSVGGVANGRAAVIAGEDSQWLRTMAESGNTWDLYWFGGSPPSTDADDVVTGSAADLFDQVLSNRSRYSMVVALDTGVSQTEVPSPGRLDTYVDNGGVYVQSGNGTIIGALGLTPDTSPPSNGTVFNTSALRRELERGDELAFDDPAYAFTSPQVSYVNRSTACLVCSWRDGKVYYVTDDNLTAATLASYGLSRDFVHDRWLFGTNTSYGTNYTLHDPEHVIPSTRAVLLERANTMERATLRFILWQ